MMLRRCGQSLRRRASAVSVSIESKRELQILDLTRFLTPTGHHLDQVRGRLSLETLWSQGLERDGLAVESIRRKREVPTYLVSRTQRSASAKARSRASSTHYGRCTAGPGHQIAKNNPMQSKMGPSSQHSLLAFAFGHEKKNGPSSRPSLISSRSS